MKLNLLSTGLCMPNIQKNLCAGSYRLTELSFLELGLSCCSATSAHSNFWVCAVLQNFLQSRKKPCTKNVWKRAVAFLGVLSLQLQLTQAAVITLMFHILLASPCSHKISSSEFQVAIILLEGYGIPIFGQKFLSRENVVKCKIAAKMTEIGRWLIGLP